MDGGSRDASAATDGSVNRDRPRPRDGETVTDDERCTAAVHGRVSFPEGAIPVAHALVFVNPEGGLTRSGTCDQCISTATLSAFAETNARGAFTLNLAPGTYELAISKGPFLRRTVVEIASCDDIDVPSEQLTLPSSRDEGEVPRIAVVRGEYDFMERVLRQLGLRESHPASSPEANASASFDLFEGRSMTSADPDIPDARTLFVNGPLDDYDLVLINCGAIDVETLISDPLVRERIKNYVRDGGRLFVTDRSYDLIEQTFPQLIDFARGGTSGLSSIAEPQNDAENGAIHETLSATIYDRPLTEWLGGLGALGIDQTIELRGFRNQWAQIDAVNQSRTTTWIAAEVPETVFRIRRPMTVTFNYGCGRVLFTSYHTDDVARSETFTPQEFVLAYMLAELLVCVSTASPV